MGPSCGCCKTVAVDFVGPYFRPDFCSLELGNNYFFLIELGNFPVFCLIKSAVKVDSAWFCFFIPSAL